MSTKVGRALTYAEVRRVAAEAQCDEKTVARYLEGVRVHATSRACIERAMRKLKLAHAVRVAAAA